MTKSVRIAAVAILFATLQVVACLPSVAQTTYDTAVQINPAHTGNIVFPGGFTPPLKQEWSVNLGGLVSYPLIANGIAYVTVQDPKQVASRLVALNLTTGATIWSQSIKGTYGTSLAAYDAGIVFDLNFNGLLQAYSAESGTLLWGTKLPKMYAFGSPPIASNGTVYVGGDGVGGDAYAVNEQTGKLIWTTFLDEGASTPAFGGSRVYMDTACIYTSFNYKTGKQLWQTGRPCFGGSNYIPVYYNNQVFDQDIAPLGGSVALTANLGQLLWSFASGGPPAIWPGNQSDPLQISSYGSNLTALDATNGSPVWTFTGDSAFAEPPITINNVVAIGSIDNTLYILDAATGVKLWSTSIPGATGSLSDVGTFEWLGAGEGTLVVPVETSLLAFVQAN